MNINDTLGKDIAFKGDFILTAAGDLDTIEGLENLKEALFRRIVTTKGSLIHRPDYGVGLKDYQNNLNSLDNQRRLAVAIKEELERDPRVDEVTGVQVILDDYRPDRIALIVKIRVVGYGETAFQFLTVGDA